MTVIGDSIKCVFPTENHCPTPFDIYFVEGQKCFYFSPNDVTYDSAIDVCDGIGGKLFEARTSEEVQFVANDPRFTFSRWLGINDRAVEGRQVTSM